MKIFKSISFMLMALIVSLQIISCGSGRENNQNGIAEVVELTMAKINEVEFKNSKNVELKQEKNIATVSGIIDAMTNAQKEAFGDESVSHMIVVKLKFDKERTISKFEIKGNKTKVYSDSNSEENYAGKLTDILDNKENEDAYVNLILSANTSTYKFTATYTDGTVSNIDLKITATLAIASAE